ncbi:hypothetical protein N9195_00205 [bacterium]|nr:hypothetical protein [bacterium]
MMTAVVQGLGQGDAGGFPTTPDAWEEPVFVAVRFPEGAKSLEEGGGNGDFAGFAAFAMADANDESLPVDVFWFEGEGFIELKTGMRDGGFGSAVISRFAYGLICCYTWAASFEAFPTGSLFTLVTPLIQTLHGCSVLPVP